MADKTKCPKCGRKKNPKFPLCSVCHNAEKSGGGKPTAGKTGKSSNQSQPTNLCSNCGKEMPANSKVCPHCGSGKFDYELDAIRSKSDGGWQVNVTVYRNRSGVKGEEGVEGVEAEVDVLDKGQPVSQKTIPSGGLNVELPFSIEDRFVQFSVTSITEIDEAGQPVKKNPRVFTKPLELPKVRLEEILQKPDHDPTKSLWENITQAWKAGRGK